MSMIKKDTLFLLIKSLSKSEKRQFKLYAGRLGVNAEKNFMALFMVLDRLDEFDESIILKRTNIKKQQLSNAKAHLYKQILISLRLNPAHQSTKVQIREQLDFASILYYKGLHKQSLKVLEKAKHLAMNNFENNLAFEIVELEKVIESQYITRSLQSRADDLTRQSEDLSNKTLMLSRLSNLALQLYGLLLKKGYVRNDEDYKNVTQFFRSKIPEYQLDQLGFKEKLFLYKAYLWYNFIIQEFVSCYKYSQRWVDLFTTDPQMKKTNPVFYLKGINYLLESLFLIKHSVKFEEILNGFKLEYRDEKSFTNENTKSLATLIYYQNKLNLYFLKGEFTEGTKFVPKVLQKLKYIEQTFDEHHIMVFYYKIASMYFGAQDNDMCIFYLGKIINNRDLKMREDLLCFSRILNLVAHYEAGYDQNLDALIKSTYKFLIKMDDMHIVQKKIMAFLRKLGSIYPHEIRAAFKELYDELKVFENHPYEKRSFMYLDILSWLESKIQGIPVEIIIKNKLK
ncbi:MAG: hypothetical protein DSY82_05680 [Flavobacteriia bacterium]|nr:MAG: hypothetical protein DSY82_05680 [Flavobacteriia bacterium]